MSRRHPSGGLGGLRPVISHVPSWHGRELGLLEAMEAPAACTNGVARIDDGLFRLRALGQTENWTWGWNVHGIWIGGYAAESQWYQAKAVDVPELPFVKTVLALVFGSMAVAIKLAIVERSSLPPRL